MKAIVVVLVSLLAVSVGAAAQDADSPLNLAGSSWQLVSMRNGGMVTPVILEGEITLDFASDTELGGSGGCNSYGGAYLIDGKNMEIGPIVSTRMACADSARMTQESTYFERLQATVRIDVVGQNLILMATNGRSELRFVARGAYGLTGSAWTLVEYGVPGATIPAIREAAPTLNFVSATEVVGSGGCNSWSGSYETKDDDLIAIEPGLSTMMACADDINPQEAVYFGLLGEASAFGFNGAVLILYTESGQVLRFMSADRASLVRTAWRLTAFVTDSSSTKVLESDAPWIGFGADGRVRGNGGCNAIESDNYVVGGGRLWLGAIRITAAGCSDGQYEGQYYSWLIGTDRYELSDNRLILMTPLGRLEFTAAGR